jgi:hypothetical protein
MPDANDVKSANATDRVYGVGRKLIGKDYTRPRTCMRRSLGKRSMPKTFAPKACSSANCCSAHCRMHA